MIESSVYVEMVYDMCATICKEFHELYIYNYIILYYVILCYIILYYVILCYVILYYITLHPHVERIMHVTYLFDMA